MIIHGIPSDYELQGDILGLLSECGGWFGDGAITVGIGKIDSKDEQLVLVPKMFLYEAIDFCRPGIHFKEFKLIFGASDNKRRFC